MRAVFVVVDQPLIGDGLDLLRKLLQQKSIYFFGFESGIYAFHNFRLADTHAQKIILRIHMSKNTISKILAFIALFETIVTAQQASER